MDAGVIVILVVIFALTWGRYLTVEAIVRIRYNRRMYQG